MTLLAIGNGSTIVLIVCGLIFVGVVIGFYTRRGSGIASHPHGDAKQRAPGATGGGEASGRDEGLGSNLDEHGGK